jgi:PAS domain S-box-containing protein
MAKEKIKMNYFLDCFTKRSIFLIALAALIFIVLYISQLYNYLLFHTTVEIMGVIPSFMIFVIVVYVWKHLENNNFLSFLGIAFFFIGLIDFAHILAYQGMPIFYGFDSDLPIQLWILARYIQVLSLLIGCLLIKVNKQINKYITFIIYAVIVSVSFWMIFILRVFPHCFIEGYGLTTFKIASEYIISSGLIISAMIIWINKEFFSGNIVKLLMLSIIAQIISELFFTSFISLYGFSNFLGHYFKVIYIILFFGAILETALSSPSKLLYLDLVKRELELREINLTLKDKINELAKAQQSLIESENQLNRALDNAPIPIMIRADNGEVLKVSHKWTEITGYTIEDIPTVSDWTTKAYGLNKPQIDGLIKSSYDSSGPKIDGEYNITTADGKVRIWQFSMANIGRSTDGRKIAIAAALDITDRKYYEEDLKKSEERLRSVFECMTEGFSIQEVICDDTGKPCDLRFLEANSAFELQTGLKNTETIGHTLLELFPKSELYWIERYGKVGLTGEAINFVDMFGPLNKYYQVSAFQTEFGKLGVLFKDVNEQKQAELEIIKAKEAAESANHAKSQFLANMSHEIRTPMNGVMGMIQLMQMTELTEEQKEFLGIAKTSSDALLVVINDILDYSKIEAGKMELEKIGFNLNKVINDVISLFKSSVMEKGLFMNVFIESNVPSNLVGDPFKLRQIMSNLIGNAVKYTNKGRIDVSVKKIKELDNYKIKLEFIVKDTGIGIPMDKKDILFKSFSQVDNSNTRKYGGTGLGLAISKSLVELMDGEICVESIEGDGSSFYFTCILEMVVDEKDCWEQSAEKLQVEYKKETDIKVLLVEDDAISRMVVERFAKQKCWNITLAENGKQAIEAYREQVFDVILMDVQMPIIDGYTAAGVIRQLEILSGSHTPIIAMTAFALKEDKERCLESGMDDYIKKPVDRNELFAVVENWVKH